MIFDMFCQQAALEPSMIDFPKHRSRAGGAASTACIYVGTRGVAEGRRVLAALTVSTLLSKMRPK